MECCRFSQIGANIVFAYSYPLCRHNRILKRDVRGPQTCILYICGLFNDASLAKTTPRRMMGRIMNWKEYGKQSRANVGSIPAYARGLRNTTKNFSRDSRSLGKYFNPGPPKY
jgi:hypothetical protein